jgi:hypothetical protein
LKKAGIRAGLSVVVFVLVTGRQYVLSPTESEIVQDLRDTRLEVGESYPVEEDTGWNESRVPKTHEERTSFEIPSLGEGARRRVLVYESPEALDTVIEYYERYFRPLASQVFVEDEVLVQIDSDLPQDEANGYDVLEEVEA